MALPSIDNQNRLISEVLKTGPADGHRLLDSIKFSSDNIEDSTWRYLLEASRSSEYAVAWREAFGRQRESLPRPNSILALAIQHVQKSLLEIDQFDARSTFQEDSIIIVVRLIANCCVDNEHSRRLAIHTGAVECFMAALAQGLNPNILVPAIYNVCVDVTDASERFQSQGPSQPNPVPVTIAEERLAIGQSQPANILIGLQILLNPMVAQNCSRDVLEYLTDLMVMAATPIRVLHPSTSEIDDSGLEDILVQLQSPNVGGLLACHSVRCKISIFQTILALSHSQATKILLARTGAIFPLALFADLTDGTDEYLGEDEQEQQDNVKLLEDLKTSMTKLVYEICPMVQFRDPPKYGIARHSIDILQDQNSASSGTYRYTIALLMLYGFIDCDARANLLIFENDQLISRLSNSMTSGDKSIVYLALSIVSKVAITWNLKVRLYEAGAVNAVHYLITSPDLGYEIPTNAITLLELLIKGQPHHIEAITRPSQENGRTLLDDIFSLFERNHDAICFEIGRLMIEIVSTLAPATPNPFFDMANFLNVCDKQTLSKILIFMATRGQEADPVSAQRIWYALGLLCLSLRGREVVQTVIRDPDVAKRMQQEISSQDDTPVKRNILSIQWTLEGQQQLSNTHTIQSSDLDEAVARMSLE